VNKKCIGKPSEAESTLKYKKKMFYEHRSTWLDLVASYCSKKNYFYVGGYFSLNQFVDPIRIESVIMFVYVCVCVLVQIPKFRVFCFMSLKVPFVLHQHTPGLVYIPRWVVIHKTSFMNVVAVMDHLLRV
jgi:hypothetical protein